MLLATETVLPTFARPAASTRVFPLRFGRDLRSAPLREDLFEPPVALAPPQGLPGSAWSEGSGDLRLLPTNCPARFQIPRSE